MNRGGQFELVSSGASFDANARTFSQSTNSFSEWGTFGSTQSSAATSNYHQRPWAVMIALSAVALLLVSWVL